MNERPRLYTRHVSGDQLATAIEVFRDQLEYLYNESEAAIDLTTYHFPDVTCIHGRAFGLQLEVRWQRVRNGFDLLLLTETDLKAEGWQSIAEDQDTLPVPDSIDPSGQVVLWGTHISRLRYPHRLAGTQGNAWIETRIPRHLQYPVQGQPQWVKARIIVYRCQGRPVLTRLVELEGEEENERQALW
jgi:hypothetical protein